MKVKDFNLKQTLECGQCFNFEKISEGESDAPGECIYEYKVIARGKMLHVRQEAEELIFVNASEEEINHIWLDYFDLYRDYGKIKEEIIKADPSLKDVINQYYGIRILNQEFIEILMSFIISQNKSIPQIKQLVRRISDHYGSFICRDAERDYHAFPTLEQLKVISEAEFREMKTGFRAPYLRDAVEKIAAGEIKGDELAAADFASARSQLMKIKGVGDKVANCVLLFGLGHRNAFPVDVWIKRIMEEMYFHKETDRKVIEKFAGELFGEYGGYAQQYLFIYAKNRQ